jgi:lysophospholipase L1-like esterase
MTMTNRNPIANLALAAGLLLAAAAPARAQANLQNYVALGDSLTAGVENGSVVVTHQQKSFVALLARQGGAQDFQQPTVSEPGIPPELTLVSLLPVVVSPKAAAPGTPTNLGLARPYNNLGIPGANAVDYASKTTDGGGPYDLVLRGLGTAPAQAVALHPTFITLWIGSNDVLGAVVRGTTIDGETLTPTPAFRVAYGQIVNTLKASGATIYAATIPDVTTLPFVTTIPPVVVNPATREPVIVDGQPVPLLGPGGSLPSGTFVTLAASSLLNRGVGIPRYLGGTGEPLPAEVILDPAEIATLKDRVFAHNRAIRDISEANGVTVVDMNQFVADITANGYLVGGLKLTADYLTGGLYSYDGIHPTDLGYAVIANEFIRVINQNGGSLEPVDLGAATGATSGSAGLVGGTARLDASFRPTGPVEFSRETWDYLLGLFPRVDGR